MLDKCCISINAKCNLACKYCHFYENNSLNMSKIKPLNYDKLLIILRRILEYADFNNLEKFTIGFAGGGEPLLDWSWLLESIKNIKTQDKYGRLYFYVITNGLLINDDFLNDFQQLTKFFHLVVSLDGNQQTHDFNRIDKKKQGTHERIMHNLNLYKQKFGVMPAINIAVGKITLRNKENILVFLERHQINNITFTRLFHCENKEQEITQEDFSKFLDFFSQTSLKIRNLEVRKDGKKDCIMYGNECGVGYNNIFYFDDMVYPCMRFSENKKFALGKYDSDLFLISEQINKLIQPIKECYYEEY